MIFDNRNGFCRCVAGAIAGGLVLTLPGCSSHEEQQAELAKAQEAAAESLSADVAGTESSSQGWESTGDTGGTAETEEDWENALPEDLNDDETVLFRNSDQKDVAFQGESPDLTVTFGEGDLYWICLQDSENGENVALAAVKQNEDTSGAAWLDAGNNDDLKDPNTVIHGSGAEDGVFVHLADYGDEAFFDRNPYFYVYTRDSVREYQVFAAYTAAEEDILAVHNFADFEEFSGYVSGIFEQRSIGAVLNAQLQQSVLDGWCMLTLDVQTGGGQSFLVQAIPTGIQYLGT